jgi:hypothetical protein
MPRRDSFAALTAYLRGQPGVELALAFPTIEAILGRPLPDAAWAVEDWWTAAGVRASHRVAWQRAGWEVAHVSMPAKVVIFQRLTSASVERRPRRHDGG